MSEPSEEAPAMEKEVIRLPDGRALTYYRFPDRRPRPARTPPAPVPGEPRGEGKA